MKKFAVGLDIGPKEIRVVTADTEASELMPNGAFSDGIIVDINAAARAVKDLFKSKNISAKNVVTAVSGRDVILRLMDVPALVPERIKDIIKDEASKYMFFAGSDLLTDFYPIEEINEEGTKKIRILSVAVKKEIIDSYVETIRLAGLNLQAIDTGSLSLARAAFFKESLFDGIVILAAVEYNNVTLFIFKDNKIHYLHNVDSIVELDSGIESVTAYCKSEFGENVKIRRIISTDFKDISITKGLMLRENKEAEFPIKINLVPLEEIKIKGFNKQVLMFTKVLGIMAVILLAYFFFLHFQTWTTFRNIAAIQDVLNRPNPVLDELLDIERMAKIYNLEIDNHKKIILKARNEDMSKILQEIKRIVPKNAYLSNLSSDERGVTFIGEALNQDTVFDFVRSLKGSKFFREIKLEESKTKESEDAARTYFVIKCQLVRDL